MADYNTLVADLHKQLVGGTELGVYPDTVMARLMKAMEDAWDLVEAAGVANQVKVTAGTEVGPWSTATSKLADIDQQVNARFKYGETSRPRNLVEAAQQLTELVRVLNASRPGGAPSGGGTPPVSGGGTLPAGTSQGKLLWAPDHSKGDSRAAGYWSNVQRQAGGGSIQNSENPIPIVDAPYEMGRALKFTIGSNTTRAEVNPANSANSFSGDEMWFGFAFALDNGFPVNARSWQLIQQLHGNDTISPRFAIQVNNGQLRVGDSQPIMSVTTGRRYNVVYRAELSAGYITVWVDGQKRLDRFKCGTSAKPYYAKIGIYHDSSIAGGTVYHGPHRIGTGYGAVYPS